MTKEEKAAYMHAYKKRMRVAKERGVDPKTLTLSDFYDDDVAKQERLKTENRLDSIRSDFIGNERKAENLRRAARNYYARHKKESKDYYKKNREQMILKKFAYFYSDIDNNRKRANEIRRRYYWRHKNDPKTWWQKLILYIRGLKWIKIIRSLKWAH